MTDTQNRTRTVTWEKPQSPAELAADLSGLEFLRKMMTGEFPPPPISLLMNFTLTEVSEGQAVFTCEPDEYHYNPLGTVHGGLAATLLDSAMACAVQSTLPAGVAYTTLEIKINFVRPMTARIGEVRVEANVIHAGGRVATSEGKIVDAKGKLYAHGTTTCMIFRP